MYDHWLTFSAGFNILHIRGYSDEKKQQFEHEFQDIKLRIAEECTITVDAATLLSCVEQYGVYYSDSFGIDNNWCLVMNAQTFSLQLLKLPGGCGGVNMLVSGEVKNGGQKELDIKPSHQYFTYRGAKNRKVMYEFNAANDLKAFCGKTLNGSITVQLKIRVRGVNDLRKKTINKQYWAQYNIISS
eukprot:CAMPEP_0202734456 /NCGR_PEP_ID=MMETSP1385-20130828/188692_1 /ASSEMBLY_ACC=CAM_ASM_000861 /TAXON_ID=933848 /ORGANISM="Elphidium margaritaceum" /LENGTH=185 /DNA_ID=CAMNT_0049400819 /DNA_START=498 /DNA_END=1051 /DNA_ORIENTATION=-